VARKFAALIAVSVLWRTRAPEEIDIENTRLSARAYVGNLNSKETGLA
jgi:hypothetical protein